MTMNQMTKLKCICNRENVKLEITKAPRYIMPFVLDCEEIVLIRKEGTMPAPFTPMIKVKEDETEEEFDLTGSPLHTSLDDSLINNPTTQGTNINEYYNHSPLSVGQAKRILNHFALAGNNTFEETERPVWALCDASDNSQTVLTMLWRRDDGWISRGTATLASSHLVVQNSNPSLDAMLKAHLEVSGAEKYYVSYQAKACYNCNRNEVSEIMDEFAGGGGCPLRMHFSWKRPHTHFTFPPFDAVSHLEMSATVGCEGNALWQDVEKLVEINSLMQQSALAERENELLMSMATMNLTVMASSVRSQVHSYICTGKLPPSLSAYKPHGAPKIGLGHLLEIYEEVAEGRRHNMDVTEVLWNILKGCNDLVELNSCFKMIIREAAAGRFIPKILADNKTSVAKIIKGPQDILQPMSLKFKGSEGLRLLWELGYLKLQRDYKHLLQRLEFSGLFDTFKALKAAPVALTKRQREEGIENLVAVHAFIETLLLLKSHLGLDDKSLSMVVMPVLPKLTSSALDLAKSVACQHNLDGCYLESSVHRMSISIPVITKISIPLIKGCHPESWSFSLSTTKAKRKIVTIFHENNEGIFPPEVIDKGNGAVCNGKENSVVKFTMLSDHLFLRDNANP